MRWDNITILQTVDRLQGEIFGGGPLGTYSGLTGVPLKAWTL
jgi:hypothetical protein